MNSILVTPEMLDAKAREVDQKAGDYYNEYIRLLNEVRTLTSTDFKGEDGTAFLNKVNDFEPDFSKMKELMNDYAQFMREAAERYRRTQHNNISQINRLQS